MSHRDSRLVVDAGSLDFLKFVDGGWKTSWLLGEKDEGKPAALVVGPVVAGVPAGRLRRRRRGRHGGRRRTLSITMRALAPAQKVSLFVNEKPAGTLDVDPTSKRYDVTVPAALLQSG